MNTTNSDVILNAVFDKKTIIKYHWIMLIPIALFIITIPFVILGAIIYKFFLVRIVDNWSATLTSRSLIVRKGVFNKIEKTIPLEKITDLSTTEGPIMRYCGLKSIGVETAGQSGASGAPLISLLGIVDTDNFRSQVLAQRDLITGSSAAINTDKPAPPSSSPGELQEIADTLRRMETLLDRIASGNNDSSGQ